MTDVYEAIRRVSSDLATVGIAKSHKNTSQGYAFRGIDQVYNVLAPSLVKHGLVILPRVVARQVVERQSVKGGVLFSVTVDMEFDFVAASDGSRHTVRTVGEAMDSGDKATNKAMSAAYKYAAFQTFCVPTEATAVDADEDTHEVAPDPAFDAWLVAFSETATRGVEALKVAWQETPVAYRERLGRARLEDLKRTANAADIGRERDGGGR